MSKDKLEKLILSTNEADNLIAREILSKMSEKEILSILTHRHDDDWFRHPIHPKGYNHGNGDALKCKKGCLPYNGFIWYTRDMQKVETYGYKIIDNL